MQKIDLLYDVYREPGPYTDDIIEHLPTLKDLSSRCHHVTEFGFRIGTSFSALLSGRPTGMLTTYDVSISNEIMSIFQDAADEENIPVCFFEKSTIEIEPIAECDLLFIDTLHTYEQLKKELGLHGNRANKFLAFHDTVSYARKGEDESEKGLMDAIEEFIEINPHWQLYKHYENNNGLTVFERI